MDRALFSEGKIDSIGHLIGVSQDDHAGVARWAGAAAVARRRAQSVAQEVRPDGLWQLPWYLARGARGQGTPQDSRYETWRLL